MTIHANNNEIKNIHFLYNRRNRTITNVYFNDEIIYSIPIFSVNQFHNAIPTTAENIIFDNIKNIDTTNLNFVSFLDTAQKISIFNINNDYYLLALNKMRFPSRCTRLFASYSNLQTVTFNNVDTSFITDIASFFYSCSALTTINWGDFNLKNATIIWYFFQDCTSLQNVDLSVFNNIGTTEYMGMFQGCTSLQNIDLSVLNPQNVTNISFMFRSCTNLQSVDFSTFVFNNAAMEYLFTECQNLQNVILVKNGIMNNCPYAYDAFYNCSRLEKIYSLNLNCVDTSPNMFYNCSSLVGGAGFVYDATKISSDYAKINTASVEGYFTDPAEIPTT